MGNASAGGNAYVPPAITVRTPYTGFVATRGKVPDSIANGNLQSMSRSRHMATDNISALMLAHAGYKCGSGIETATAVAVTYTASIEYPVGQSPTRITYAGANSGVCAAGDTLFSDMVILPVSIPRGVTFYIRIYASMASGGLPYCVSAGLNTPVSGNPASGEWWQLNASGIADVTGSTTNNTNGIAQNVGMQLPLAIIGTTTRASVFIVGDSRTVGDGGKEVRPNSAGFSGNVVKSAGKYFGYCNVSASSERMSQVAAGALIQRMRLAQYCTHVVCGYGINDFQIGGRTAAQCLADLATFVNLFSPLKPFIVCTVEPDTTSTDGFGTTANQTVISGSVETNRQLYNSTLRQGQYNAPILATADIASAVESPSTPGAWLAAQRSAADMSITTGTAVLTSSGAAKFTPSDIGLHVSVIGAGAAGAVLTAFISAYTSATSVTLSANAGTTVGPTATAYIGLTTFDGLHSSYVGTSLMEAANLFGALNVFE